MHSTCGGLALNRLRLCFGAVVAVVSILFANPRSAIAELLPAQIAIIVAKGSNESRSVGAYYAKVRGIPAKNILQLDFPSAETLPRQKWVAETRPAIRSFLAKENRLRTIRCFVTVWDVPAQISPDPKPKELQRLVGYLKRERASRVKILNASLMTLDQLADGSSTEAALAADATVTQMTERLQAALTGAQQRIEATTEATLKEKQLNTFRSIYARAIGLNSVAQNLERSMNAGAAGAAPGRLQELRITQGRAFGLREGRSVVESMPLGLDREPQLLAIIQMTDGLLGSINWLDGEIESLAKNETGASFDSELALAAWPDYQLVRWQPNYLNYRYDDSPIRDYKISFMVSRLEAPTLALTRKIIDDAIATEKAGLQGKIYLDGRGLAREGQPVRNGDVIQAFDQLLMTTASVLKEAASSIEVVHDTKQGLFEPGSAPDAALYCGWYSLAKYVDAFDFSQGAIGYHLGGAEASKLRAAGSQLWCNRLLEDGVASTLGPVADGPVTTFPRPNEFFVLLLSGRYSLAECFYRSNPLNSWTMTLIGDPMYTPFKANSPLDVTKLPDDLRRVVEGANAVLQ